MTWSVCSSRPRRAAGGWVFVAALVLAGCAGKPMGNVSGKVTYRGQPVTRGTVQFYDPEQGRGASGPLDASGAYTLSAPISPGNYKVYIQPPLPEQLPPGTRQKAVAFEVPKQYQDANSTPLTKAVTPGNNDIPIELPN
jgi:hypothetical protein